jgi:hypothetical protein
VDIAQLTSERRVTALAIALLIVLYVGGYFATVQPTEVAGEFLERGLVRYEKAPEYRVGGNLAVRLYAPLHYLDRHYLRPMTWEGHVVSERPAEKPLRWEVPAPK